MTDYQ